ncbi:MAG TPA: tRNA (adenosine(37)-N6)-threonylcarbamoyltransferase complex ATPase subunit type 1 TsaE [Opitutaceae bacterium]|nr:tRNA (adenosine(37)-N6)-threonylcarbamoyltransferase complex ATPase subunit type 1 TsaE [Opitutaceae bacterium]
MATNIWQELEQGAVVGSADAMHALARRLGETLPPESVLALSGDLGVGKTTFVQGLAEAFGIRERVTSPTFTLYNVHRGSRTLVHLDAYRLESPEQVEDLLLEDFLVAPYCLAIEWPERIAGWLPAGSLTLRLSIVTPGTHRVQLVR